MGSAGDVNAAAVVGVAVYGQMRGLVTHYFGQSSGAGQLCRV
jgi:hypothetical protein